MARIVGGIGISHSPSMGVEFDRGMTQGWDPRWKLWFDGLQPVKSWLEEMRPDHIVIVYNDHLNHFTFDAYPTFAAGVAPVFPQADEGWGPRALPDLRGDPQFGWHMCTELVAREFDLTVCQEMRLDHGIYSWIPYITDFPRAVPVFPIAVNMLRFPMPLPERLRKLGVAIREAVHAYGEGRVVVIATEVCHIRSRGRALEWPTRKWIVGFCSGSAPISRASWRFRSPSSSARGAPMRWSSPCGTRCARLCHRRSGEFTITTRFRRSRVAVLSSSRTRRGNHE